VKLFSAIKSVFSSAPAKTVDDIMDSEKGLLVKFGGFVNDLHYSDAEKAAAMADVISGASEFVKSTMGESTERSKTRRAIAIYWIKFQLALIALTVVTYPVDTDTAEFYWKVATSKVMLFGTLSVIVFFFGAHVLRVYNPLGGPAKK
jgi:hypothetical protein